MVRPCLASVALVATCPSAAQAAEDAEARRLFEEGRQQLEAGSFERACASFQRSFVLGGSEGPLLNWAECEEARGRPGTALRLFRQAEARLGDDLERRDFARTRAESLAVRVATLTVIANDDPVVLVNGLEVDERGPVPLDPGKTTVTVNRSMEEPKTYELEMEAGERRELDLRGGAPKAGGGVDATTDWSLLGWVLGGTSAAGWLTFAVSAGVIVDQCGGLGPTCTAASSDVTGAHVANILGLVVGVGALGAAIPLWVLGANADARTRVQVGPLSASLEVMF
jgi:hypothetical protein